MRTKSELSLKISRLFIHKSHEQDGDEIYIKFAGKKIWPSVKRYHSFIDAADIGITIELTELSQWIELELWDYNFLLPSLRLGIFRILPENKGGPYHCELIRRNGTFSKYLIEWTVE
jgi:hypothetical protein